jgi:hypothetical protein
LTQDSGAPEVPPGPSPCSLGAAQLDLHPEQKICTSLSRSGSVRAARLLAEIGDTRGHDHPHPHAVRLLARVRVNIIWACWTTNTPYDPDRHGALQRLLNQDQPSAA